MFDYLLTYSDADDIIKQNLEKDKNKRNYAN